MDREEVAKKMCDLGYRCEVVRGVVVFYEPIEKAEECEKAIRATGYNASFGVRGIKGEE